MKNKDNNNAGYCDTLNSSSANVKACKAITDPIKCHNMSECKWEINTGTRPEDYKDKIISLQKQFEQYIEEKTINCGKGILSNSTKCADATSQINNIKKYYDETTSELESDINLIEKNIQATNDRINKLDKDNEKLNKQLNSAFNKSYGAQGMITDTQYLYTQEFIANWILAFFLIGYIITVWYSGNVTVSGVRQQASEITTRVMPGITSMIR